MWSDKIQKTAVGKRSCNKNCPVCSDYPEKLEKIGPNCSWIGPHQLNKSAQVVESA